MVLVQLKSDEAFAFVKNCSYYYTPFNSLFSRTTSASQYQKGKTSLDSNEARDDEVWGCCGISWTICKQSAPHSRPHHSIFTGRKLFLTPNQQCQSIEGSHMSYVTKP